MIMKICLSIILVSLIMLGGFVGSAAALSYSASVAPTLTLVFGDPPEFTDPSLAAVLNWLNTETDFKDVATFKEGTSSDLIVEGPGLDFVILPDDLSTLTNDQWTQGTLGFNFGEVVALKTQDNTWKVKVMKNAPEPSTVFLVGMGLLGLVALRRKRKK
jgi:hypothetical protein